MGCFISNEDDDFVDEDDDDDDPNHLVTLENFSSINGYIGCCSAPWQQKPTRQEERTFDELPFSRCNARRMGLPIFILAALVVITRFLWEIYEKLWEMYEIVDTL